MSARVLAVQFQADAPPAWLGEWLVAEGCAVDVREPQAAELDGYDALVVMGGTPGANDDLPGVDAAKELVRQAAEQQLPTLGVCLGHQVAAVALGGTVTRNPQGQQLGLTAVGWLEQAADDPMFGSLTDVRRGLHWNSDVVVELPPSATLIASAPTGEVQAARHGETVWGVQWHPEVDDRIVAHWAEEDGANHPPGVADAAVADVRAARRELEQGWRGLARNLVALASVRHR